MISEAELGLLGFGKLGVKRGIFRREHLVERMILDRAEQGVAKDADGDHAHTGDGAQG